MLFGEVRYNGFDSWRDVRLDPIDGDILYATSTIIDFTIIYNTD